jgi:hypothetical protein
MKNVGTFFIFDRIDLFLSPAFPMRPRLQLENSNFPAQRISVDPQRARGAGLIALYVIQYLLDVAFFKLIDGFRK